LDKTTPSHNTLVVRQTAQHLYKSQQQQFGFDDLLLLGGFFPLKELKEFVIDGVNEGDAFEVN
jgi:hypothetical protein